MPLSFLFLLLVCIFFSLLSLSSLAQNITSFNISISPWRPNQNLTLLSQNSVFAAGFLPLPTSPNRFAFSVWFRQVPQSRGSVVWSANPHSPLNTSASLVITSKGELFLNDSSGHNLWPPQNAPPNSNFTSLVLHNDGNLIFGNWESFNFPTDTILPNQTITNIEIYSNNGIYKFSNATDLLLNSTSATYFKASDAFEKLGNDGKMSTANSGYFITSDFGDNHQRKLVLDNDGNLRIYSLYLGGNRTDYSWVEVWRAVKEICKIKGTCGSNSICIPQQDFYNSTNCICPPGFKPKDPGGPNKDGCSRKIPLPYITGKKFIRLDFVNFTGSTSTEANNFSVCKTNCLRDRTCSGFGFKFDGFGYCALLHEPLLYGYWSPDTETALFLRVDESEPDKSNFTGMTEILETTCPVNISLPFHPPRSDTTTRNIAIICTLFAAELVSGVLCFWAFLKKYIKYRNFAQTLGLELLVAGGPKRFSYSELKKATNGFSNLIGRGGFGDVYKGVLSDSRVVAVKCLKNVLTGGDGEFWAEVTIIARMHHLNLVRLWGFCAEEGRRILVYEYVPNGSLDKCLFEAGKRGRPVLDWNIRYRIALGVARAIAYLHEECLELVVHCDVKPENILLGDDFCPKLSDFGLAKLRKKEEAVSVSKIRGTRGYLAPEWVKLGRVTPKADVYSFGMVLLEIVGGVRNFEIRGGVTQIGSENWYLPKWAFEKVFQEMKLEEVLDKQIRHSYDSRAHFDMVNRMVKTAIWCLQYQPENRPTMGKVAKMLDGTVDITDPKIPTHFFLPDE